MLTDMPPRRANRVGSAQHPKRKQVYCDFAGDFFGDVYAEEKFPSPETLEFKPYFLGFPMGSGCCAFFGIITTTHYLRED